MYLKAKSISGNVVRNFICLVVVKMFWLTGGGEMTFCAQGPIRL